jgi:hypothetical protein
MLIIDPMLLSNIIISIPVNKPAVCGRAVAPPLASQLQCRQFPHKSGDTGTRVEYLAVSSRDQ